MARPSNKEKRTIQILNAFEWCVARYGVEGSTLDKIADKANLARALIRHHIGNRDQLLDLLVEHIINKSNESLSHLVNSLPEKDRVDTLISFLFDTQYSDPQMILVFSALITAAHVKPELAQRLNLWVNNFIDTIASQISKEYKNCDKNKISAVSTGITGIYFNVDSLFTLGDISQIRSQSKEAVFLLINGIK